MSDVIVKLRKLNEEEKARQKAFYREKRFHDEASALGSARREGEAKGRADRDVEIAYTMRKKGYTEEQIKDLLDNA